MRLFHFTARRYLLGIQRDGLTLGRTPRPVRLRGVQMVTLEQGTQWLTRNDSFAQECLVGTGRLPYSRTEVRLTIDIPQGDARLRSWAKESKSHPARFLLNTFGDPENWYRFHGNIPPEWIVAIDYKPVEVSA